MFQSVNNFEFNRSWIIILVKLSIIKLNGGKLKLFPAEKGVHQQKSVQHPFGAIPISFDLFLSLLL